MGFFLIDWLKKFGSLMQKVFDAAVRAGIAEPLMKLAIAYVKEAATKFTDNAQKREYVVRKLMERGVPESVARLLVELAVTYIKKGIDQLDD